jgi:hypothetical protein
MTSVANVIGREKKNLSKTVIEMFQDRLFQLADAAAKEMIGR